MYGDDRAQSAVMGSLLMVAIALVAVAGIAVGLFLIAEEVTREPAPSVSVGASVTENDMVFTHQQGAALHAADLEVVLTNATGQYRLPVAAYTSTDRLTSGDRWAIPHASGAGEVVVALVHTPSESLLARATAELAGFAVNVAASPASGSAPLAVSFDAQHSGGAAPPTAVDFSAGSIDSYGGSSQDQTGPMTVADDGRTLSLGGNRWKSVATDYTVTDDTVISFDFRSDSEGEIHAIGLETDSSLTSNRFFRLFGTQNWGTADYATYTADGWTTYQIPVGDYYTGTIDRIAFVNDHDVGSPDATSWFRDVRVYEADDGYQYEWDFGDGTTASGPSPGHTYHSAGTYTVTLTATDSSGATASATRTVTVDDPSAYVVSGGRVVFEADGYTGSAAGTGAAAGSAWTSQADADAVGGTALLASPNSGVNVGDSTDGPRLDYEVEFPTAGTYYVWVRMEGPTGNDDSVHVGLDGTPETYGNYGLTASGDWRWDNTVDGRSGPEVVTVTVPSAGVHTVNLWMREDGTRIDRVLLTDDAGYTPTGEGPSAGSS